MLKSLRQALQKTRIKLEPEAQNLERLKAQMEARSSPSFVTRTKLLESTLRMAIISITGIGVTKIMPSNAEIRGQSYKPATVINFDVGNLIITFLEVGLGGIFKTFFNTCSCPRCPGFNPLQAQNVYEENMLIYSVLIPAHS